MRRRGFLQSVVAAFAAVPVAKTALAEPVTGVTDALTVPVNPNVAIATRLAQRYDQRLQAGPMKLQFVDSGNRVVYTRDGDFRFEHYDGNQWEALDDSLLAIKGSV